MGKRPLLALCAATTLIVAGSGAAPAAGATVSFSLTDVPLQSWTGGNPSIVGGQAKPTRQQLALGLAACVPLSRGGLEIFRR